ncbi:hypothetical protein [Azospirillum sp. TSH64]|uniref:hypothetical protein n=1 Tax=Azospirillum sp. TSH64 TaxID=652740 RepID=UPI000D621169|nr:hypothetical protein [Azospirillum sp. TSH64]PWC78818.1 hypothetical protein TSH64_32575 [Azospirillum sp. TSH64]
MTPVNALFGKPAAVAASLALGALFLSAGWATLPTRHAAATVSYQLAAPMDGTPAASAAAPAATPIPVPVFLMQPDHATMRSGTGLLRPDGRVDITLFDPSDPRLIHGSEALLFNTEFRVLWLLATDEERARLWRGIEEVGRGLRTAMDGILESPEFTGEYRDALQEIGRMAIEEAWRAPSTRATYEEFLRSAEPMLHDTVGRDLKAIAMKQVEPLVWNLIGANVGMALDPFRSQSWDLGPVDQAVDAILREAREAGLVNRAARQLADSWQAKAFLKTFAGNVVDALAHQQRLRDVAGRMVNDPRLGAYLKPVSGPAGDLARLAPDLLFGVQAGADLNALAAHTFQGFLTGRGGPLIVMMSARQREDILTLDRYSPRILLHAVPQ